MYAVKVIGKSAREIYWTVVALHKIFLFSLLANFENSLFAIFKIFAFVHFLSSLFYNCNMSLFFYSGPFNYKKVNSCMTKSIVWRENNLLLLFWISRFHFSSAIRGAVLLCSYTAISLEKNSTKIQVAMFWISWASVSSVARYVTIGRGRFVQNVRVVILFNIISVKNE